MDPYFTGFERTDCIYRKYTDYLVSLQIRVAEVQDKTSTLT